MGRSYLRPDAPPLTVEVALTVVVVLLLWLVARVQDYHMKKRWLRTIDSYIHRNAPSVEVEMARDQKRAHAAARAAQRAWDPFGSPYAQPVVPGLFKDQKPQRWRAPVRRGRGTERERERV